MSRFAHVLRRLDAQLVLPEPERTQALLEIGGDLEAAYEAYRVRGLGDAEAMARAAALLGPSEHAATDLSRLHRPGYAAWLTRLAPGRWERAVLSLVTAAALAGSAVVLRGAVVLQTPGLALWLLYALAGAVVGTAAAAALATAGVDPESRARAAARVGRLPLLAAASALVGLIGGCVEVWRWSRALPRDGGVADFLLTVGRAAEVATVGVSIALCALLVWFHLHRRVVLVQRLRAELGRIVPATEEASWASSSAPADS